jgi:hypothetical protein
MVDTLVYIFIILAIGIAIIAEILVAYQKYLMKKQFVKDLDQKDGQGNVEQNPKS